jgi:hypothetical protein
MIGSRTRTLEVGTTGLVWAVVTDRAGQDMTGLGVELRATDPDGVAGTWVAPDDTGGTPETGVVRAAYEHTATAPGVGWWKLQMKLTNGTLVEVVTAGVFQVV